MMTFKRWKSISRAATWGKSASALPGVCATRARGLARGEETSIIWSVKKCIFLVIVFKINSIMLQYAHRENIQYLQINTSINASIPPNFFIVKDLESGQKEKEKKKCNNFVISLPTIHKTNASFVRQCNKSRLPDDDMYDLIAVTKLCLIFHQTRGEVLCFDWSRKHAANCGKFSLVLRPSDEKQTTLIRNQSKTLCPIIMK